MQGYTPPPMRREKRTGFVTLLWLTLYVGVAPFVSITAVMFLSRVLGATDEGWGWLFALGYLGAVYLGAQMYARHFERR
jgi:hypothetical protein